VPLKPSLRTQWVLALLVAALVIAGIVIVVADNGGLEGTPAPPISKAAVVEENRIADVLVREDQAPHVQTLPRHVPPAVGSARAVRAFMAEQIAGGHIAGGHIAGPIEHAGCAATHASSAARIVLRCTVQAADVAYPFDVVVTPANRQVTFCKRDYPPVPSMNIPVSSRCT
jgi:hypothetical protein